MMLLSDEIKLTLWQASLFSYPLRQKQVYERLLTKCSERDFLATIEALKCEKLICEQSGYLYLVYSDIDIRSFKQRQKISRKKREQINYFLRFLQKFPLVSAVALTGSMAINNAREDDDIDFLIITKPKSLYIARAVVTILSTFCGHKRTRKIGAAQKDQWCFNMWLTEDNLRVPRDRQTLYSAYELLQADFVIDKDEMQKKLWQENKDWLSFYLRNANCAASSRSVLNCDFLGAEKGTLDNVPFAPAKNRIRTSRYVASAIYILQILNPIFFHLQYWKMRSRITREIVTREQAFFHPRPTRIMDKKDLIKQHQAFLGTLKNDLGAPREIVNAALRARKNGKVVVLVTGVFDLLHVTHLEFLQKAQQLGEVLIVGVESDKRVRELKGEKRPLRSELVRLSRIKQLQITDQVFVLPENFGEAAAREKLLKEIRPDILAVSLKTAHLKAKKDLMSKMNIELIIVPLKNTQVSTTAILNKKISADNLLFVEDKEVL